MSIVATIFSPRWFKRTRNSAIAIFIVSVLVCELPLLFALVGLGGFLSVDAFFLLPPLVEIGVYISGTLALVLLLGLFIYRLRFKSFQ